MKLEQLAPFLAGFDLGGWKRNGKIYSHIQPTSVLLFDVWPDEIEAFGTTYTLEGVEDGRTDERGTFQNAIYV